MRGREKEEKKIFLGRIGVFVLKEALFGRSARLVGWVLVWEDLLQF